MAEYSEHEFSRAQKTLQDEDEISWQVRNVASWTKKTPVEHCDVDSSESRSSQIHLKNEFVDDLVALPYPKQETDHGTEGVGNQSEKIAQQEENSATSTCSNSFDSTEQKAKEVTSLECNFEDTKSSEDKHKSSFGRRTESEPPPEQHKMAQTKEVKKRRIPSSLVREVPKDSNVYRSGSGSVVGSDRGKKQKTLKEDKGGIQPTIIVSTLDNAEQYLSPGCGEATIMELQFEEEMKVDIPATDNRSESQEKMQYCNPAIPSMSDNPEQCHIPGRGEAATTGQKFDVISLQDLQHACYCCKPVDCHNKQCKNVKAEIKHMKDHQGWKQCLPCLSCAKTHAVIHKHAKVCKLRGCRVPNCHNIRNGTSDNKGTGKKLPTQAPRQNHAPSEVNNLAPERDKHKKKAQDKSDVDGKVLFWNFCLKLPPSNNFIENTDYTVDRNCRLGAGSNGTIYRVSLLKERTEIAVKQTKFRQKELEVYKSLGYNKNIVTHYGVTLRGSDCSKVNIFMEKCDLSLFKHMQNLKRRLSVDEAMFYWVQVLAAVFYLHNLPTPVIHKDIKAKNVLITEELAKLCDFDSAMRLPKEFTDAGLKPCGTEGFMSHEVINRKSHGKPTDIYSMGCSLIELTIGVPTKDTLNEKIDKLREVDADLAQLVEACVKECPEERPTACSLLEYPVVKKYTTSSRRC